MRLSKLEPMSLANDFARNAGRGRMGVVTAIIVFALAQALFWLALGVTERLSQPRALSRAQEITLVLSDAGGEFGPGATSVTAQRTHWPHYLYVDPERRPKGRFELRFDAPPTNEPIALYLNYTNTLGDIRLNGELLKARLDGNMWVALDVFAPVLVPLPAEALSTRDNLIEIEATGAGRKLLAPFAIDRVSALQSPYQWGGFIATVLPLASVAIMVFTIILCLVTRWPKADVPWIRAFVALLAAWAAYNLLSLGLLSPLMPQSLFWRHAIHWALLYAFVFSFVRFVFSWTEAPRSATWIAASVFLAFLVAAVAVHPLNEAFVPETGRRVSQEIRKSLEHAAIVGAGAVMTALLLRDLTRRPGRLLESFLFLVGVTGVTVDAIDDRFSLHVPFMAELPLTFSIGPACGLLLSLGMCAALARQAAEARHVVINANAELAAKLAQKEGELADGYAQRNRIMQRAVVLEERQRIVRDMHDGIGGKLLGLKVQVRSGQMTPAAIEAALDDSITDMRLIVDSLDMADETLSVALRTFENRVRQQIEAAGCACDIRHLLDNATPNVGPRTTLQILRILQEAVANALRHGAPTSIRIESAASGDGHVTISVIDNGRGMPAGAVPGRGLTNMRFRANTIGAHLAIASGSQGSAVRLTLPARASDGDDDCTTP